jgi:hypothetical protein
MRQYFIKGYNKKYSIREDGSVIRHYRINKYAKPIYCDRVVKPQINKWKGYEKAIVALSFGKKQHKKSVSKIMELYFLIKKPNDHTNYKLINKDGNATNNSIENLKYARFTTGGRKSKGKYYDRKIYNGEVLISIRCIGCEAVKNTNEFYRRSVICKTCYQESDCYINALISNKGMNPDVFTKEMKDIVKIQIQILREIKNN